jgi:hypothetical protein
MIQESLCIFDKTSNSSSYQFKSSFIFISFPSFPNCIADVTLPHSPFNRSVEPRINLVSRSEPLYSHKMFRKG